MTRSILLKLVFVFCLFSLTYGNGYAFSDIDKEPYYFSIPAKKGDGIQVLLKRYKLYDHGCNLVKFYELNNLKPKDFLKADREYKLPIKIYKYNGKSIRSTIGNSDYEKAVRIQKYNEFLKSHGLRKTLYKDSKILWVPHHELGCASIQEEESVVNKVDKANGATKPKDTTAEEVETTSSKKGVYGLFGDKYKLYDIVDNSLKGQVFYVVSGHGGPDPGTNYSGENITMCEDEYAYDVCLRLARNLMQRGAIAHVVIQDANDGIRDELYLQCDKDERSINGKAIPLNHLKRLKQRTQDINALYKKHKAAGIKSQKAIMVHVDSRAQNKRQDVFFYYHKNNVGGKELTKNVFKTFSSKYEKYRGKGSYHGYFDQRGLYVLRNVKPAAVYVELANIKNKTDHKRLIYASNRDALANWLMEGLIK